MKKCITTLVALAFCAWGTAQSFTNSSGLLPDSFNSGGCVGITDMDQDGLDDIIVLDGADELNIYYQEVDGSFEVYFYGDVGGSQWGMCAGDVDDDGHHDVFCGGNGDGVHYIQISGRGAYSQTNLDNGSMFMQGCNIVDIDNDGQLDAFGCHDVGLSRTWGNDGSGNLSYDGSLIDLTNYDFTGYPGTDHSGNYGSVWTDFDCDGDIDMYLAKCRQGVNDPNDPRRINQLWVNDGAGNFTEEALARGLVFYEQSWTSDFADVDNDGDFDCFVTNHSDEMFLYENDGTGNFTDVTGASGFSDSGFFLQGKLEDLDNDGWVDLIYTGGVHKYYRNDGDGTFTEVPNMFPYGDTMHSLSIGDLNNDGALDVYASYGNGYVNADASNPDILWMNDGNANNWISFDLEGTTSNTSAIGAKAKLYGNWGIQVREIRAGESYGIVNSFKCHFGMGTETVADSVVIDWPSGMSTTIVNPAINQLHHIPEADCLVSSPPISPVGPHVICPGDILVLTAPAGFDEYLWNTGEITQSINVTAQGNFYCMVTDASNCMGISAAVAVDSQTPAPPTATADDVLEFCEGSSVNLNSSPGVSYLWSNGEVTQNIAVTTTGTYSVDVTDICGDVQTSNAIDINVLAGPGFPDVDDEVLPGPGSATFTGTSANLQWYDAVDAVVPVATGDTYMTPVITETTSYWVEDIAMHGGVMASSADSTDNEGQYHSNSNNWILFDVHEELILNSVKVYANGDANRTIELIDELGNVLESGTFFILDGEQVVTLDWTIPVGTQYGLRSTSGNPQLWRHVDLTDGAGYPFNVGSSATITGSSVTGGNQYNYYYFFYNWQVTTVTVECTGPRVEVVATVAPEGCTDPAACNYDPAALIDDGSCDYSCFGCTDNTACNYSAVATIDDGSCFYNCLSCAADFNNDGDVNTPDLLVMLANYGCGPPDLCLTADFNNDLLVNVSDLLQFLSVFNTVCDQ